MTSSELPEIPKPNLFNYLDINSYLKDFYQCQQLGSRKFSYLIWAQQLGFSNKTLLQLMVQGKRTISPGNSEVFKSYFEFTSEEKDYFDILVSLSRAKAGSQKKALLDSLLKIQRSHYHQVPISHDSGILDDALYPVVLTLLNFSDVATEPSKIAQLLERPIEEIHKAIAVVKANKDAGGEDNGRGLKSTSYKIADKYADSGLMNYYRHWLNSSVAALNLPKDLRKFRSLLFALSEDEYADFAIRMNDFAMLLLNKYHTDTLKDRRLYMFKMAAFPVTNKFSGESTDS